MFYSEFSIYIILKNVDVTNRILHNKDLKTKLLIGYETTEGLRDKCKEGGKYFCKKGNLE